MTFDASYPERGVVVGLNGNTGVALPLLGYPTQLYSYSRYRVNLVERPLPKYVCKKSSRHLQMTV